MGKRVNTYDSLGGRAGPRIAKLVVDAMSDHLRQSGAHRARIHTEGVLGVFRTMSAEKRQHTAPFTSLYLGSGKLPSELEEALRFMTHGEGELAEVMNSLGLGGAISGSILSGISNYLAPINQHMIASDPNALLDAATLASLVVRGWVEEDYAHGEAQKGGISDYRFGLLKRLAENYPSLGETLELWRRGLINEGEAAGYLERNAVATAQIPQLLSLKREHLAPADAALAVLRGTLTEPEGAKVAEAAGIEPADFKTLVENTGEPPGLEQMLEAYRRGFVSKGELEKAIRYSRVRDEYIPVVEKLRFSPASPADAVNAVVQGHLGADEAKQIAEWGGLRPQDFSWLVENAGNPMANMQAIELWNRGVITQGRVEEAIREGRTKDKYIPDILKLRVKLPPAFETIKMMATGGVSPERGAEILMHEGYEQDVVAGLVHAATSEQATKAKALAETQVSELYEEMALTLDEAVDHLGKLGLSKANAKMVLSVADLKRERKLVDAALTPIRAQYVARHISESEASSFMDLLRIPAAQRDLYLQLWTIERVATRKVLTPAQVVTANKLQLIPDAAAEERLLQHGYSLEDARILIDSEKGRTVPAP